jgi:hypothetical protein
MVFLISIETSVDFSWLALRCPTQFLYQMMKHVKVQEIIQWSKSRLRLFLPLSTFNRTGRSVIVLCRALLKAIATPVEKKIVFDE